jgi:carboxyl-terminal processing protease
MSSKILRVVLGSAVGFALAVGLFSAGVVTGALLPRVQDAWASYLPWLPEIAPESTLPARQSTPSPSSPDREALFAPFWQAWDILHTQFVDQPLDDLALMRGAIRGMFEALGDPHTSYMDPDEYRQANIPLEGQYEGIGAWVDPDAEFLTIVSPMPDSPAERAGLRPGDQIVAVDGEDMTGVDGNLVIRRVLGPAGTRVRLTVRRAGSPELLEFEVVRQLIRIPSVEGEVLDGGVAYVRLFTFGDRTTRDLRRELRRLLDENPRGMVLDLRGNGGGFLDTAVEVASEFIGEGVILVERFGDGREQVYQAQPGGLATQIPLVVLVDAGTASASEIVAGAIQDHGRGLLIGDTTFGKGSVQNWLPLEADGGAVRVTIARWYTPEGRLIHDQGLTPDIVVALEPGAPPEEDPQLERAIEEVLKRAN